MDINLKLNGRMRLIDQSEESRELLAGDHFSTPYTTARCKVSSSDTDGDVVTIQAQDQIHGKKVCFEDTSLRKGTSLTFARLISEDVQTSVIDMGNGSYEQAPTQIENNVMNISVREPGVSEQDCNINLRGKPKRIQEATDIKVTEEKGGHVICGNFLDVCKLVTVSEFPASPNTQRGVICNSEVLRIENGDYIEGQQYKVVADTKSGGAYGETVMCEDLKTHKTYIRKKVYGTLFKNEVLTPLMFRGNPAVPEIFGVIMRNKSTEIFQEFAGLSLKKLCETEYAARVRNLGFVLGLAFQGFSTLDKMHKLGIQHLDIKPENICVDVGQRVPSLKLIDFGSSQLPREVMTEGLTNEYLSPESCLCILNMASGQPSEGRLGPGTDVWALSLSLLYLLCGYHVMVYMHTGEVYYPTDPKELSTKRLECLVKACKLTDLDVWKKLIRPEWPQVLKELLMNTLRVNPENRWSAETSAAYILKYLQMEAQRSLAQEMVASSRGFTLSPARFGVQTAQNGQQSLPVQCDSPATIRASLPAFEELLSNNQNETEYRSCKRKHQEQSAKLGYKVMKK